MRDLARRVADADRISQLEGCIGYDNQATDQVLNKILQAETDRKGSGA
jgi:hypothetical protein